MPLVMPIEPKSRDIWDWLQTSGFISTWSWIYSLRKNARNAPPSTDEGEQVRVTTSKNDSPTSQTQKTFAQHFLQFLKGSFLVTFPFDGYNTNTGEITSADGKENYYRGESLPLWVIITSLLGLPNRAAYVDNNGIPRYTVAQFFRNFIGGWNPIFFKGNTDLKILSTDKKIAQILGLPVKIFLILPIKLISIPFKILLNAVKLITEFLLPIFSVLTATLNMLMLSGIRSLLKWTVVKTKSYQDHTIHTTKKRSGLRVFLAVFVLIPLAVLTIAVFIFQYATVLACRMGLALTSPAKSAQSAFALGRSIKIGEQNSTLQELASIVMGVLGALVSLTLSAVLWTITLPLALGALVTAIPSILTAITWLSQIPFVAASLTWASQLSVVTGSTALLNSLFSTIGIALAAAFGPAATALASLISVQIPAVVMVVGTTLGLLVTPVAAMLSLGADKLSDLWATWIEEGPIAYLRSLIFRGSSKVRYAQLNVFTRDPRHLEPSALPKIWKLKDVHGEVSNVKTTPTAFLYDDTKSEHRVIVVSPVALDIVGQNKHLQHRTEVSGAMAQECFLKAEQGYFEGKVGIHIKFSYRTPTDKELPQETRSNLDGTTEIHDQCRSVPVDFK